MTNQGFDSGPDAYTTRIIEDTLQMLESRVMNWDNMNVNEYEKFIEVEMRSALSLTLKDLNKYIIVPVIDRLQRKVNVRFVKIPKPFLDMMEASDVFIISYKNNSYYVAKNKYGLSDRFIDHTFLTSLILNPNNSVVVIPRKKILNSAYGEIVKPVKEKVVPKELNGWEDMMLLMSAGRNIKEDIKITWDSHDIVIITFKDGKYFMAKNRSSVSGMFIDEAEYKYITEIMIPNDIKRLYIVSFEELKRNIVSEEM